MPPDKIKFKQILKEIQKEQIDLALQSIQLSLDKEEWDAAEASFDLLLQDLRRLGWAKGVADK